MKTKQKPAMPAIIAGIVALWVTMVALRIYEVRTIQFPGAPQGVKGSYIASGILLDLFLAGIVMGIYIVLAILIRATLKRNAFWIFHVLALTAIFSNLSLIEYFLVTHIPLDESIFFFSLEELELIIGAGDRFTISVILGIVGLLALYALTFWWLGKRKALYSKRWTAVGVSLSLVLLTCSFFSMYRNEEKPVASALINNKLTYFVGKSISYANSAGLQDQEAVILQDFAGLDTEFLSSGTVSEDYPLMHELPDESMLDSYLPKSGDTPPNVVVLICESLTAHLLGERADETGHLMPFLDSLSKQSLFFPNVFSTAERTHNVLPAILSSVPNAPEGQMLQQMEYPMHFSLINLLKPWYHSRFYCGVNLRYCNMVGYMNYLQTDDVVKNFGTDYSLRFDGRRSPWGYPDGELFRKALDEQENLNTGQKSRLDVFLTISTHDPYIYPRMEYYRDFVLRQVSKAEKKRGKTAMLEDVKKNAVKLGSYRYLDDELKAYFKRVSKLPGYENTIFIITGDHAPEICIYDELSRFKVPVFIYSPKLKTGKTFPAVSTHLDIAPTLINYLRLNYCQDLPKEVPFIGREMDTYPTFRQKRSLVFNSLQLRNVFLYQDGYFAMGERLWKADKRLVPHQISDPKRLKHLQEQLKLYDLFNVYTLVQNKVVPAAHYGKYVAVEQYDEVKLFQTRPDKKGLEQLFIDIGDMEELPCETEFVKIECRAEVFCRTQKTLDQLPVLGVSLENRRKAGNQLLTWQTVKAQLKSRFRPNEWNPVSYTITMRLSDYKHMECGNNRFKFLMINDKKIYQPMRLFNTRISISQKKQGAAGKKKG